MTPDPGLNQAMVESIEGLGFDALFTPDHPIIGYDAWTQLALAAQLTKRVRLGTLVTCASYKNPVVLARQVADVDRISGGRAILGLGSGDMPWEFAQLGIGWGTLRERQQRLADALEIIPSLLAGDTVTFSGEQLSVADATLRSPALQQPRVPILVAGGGEKVTLRLVARHADASNTGAASWAGGVFTLDDARRKYEVLRGHAEVSGRPYEDVLRTATIGFTLAPTRVGLDAKRQAAEANPQQKAIATFLEGVPNFSTPAEAIEMLAELVGAGVQYFVILAGPDLDSLELLASEVVPQVRARAAL